MIGFIWKALFLMHIASTNGATITKSRKDNLIEIALEPERHLASEGCIDDTQEIDKNNSLQRSFNDVLSSFSTSFNLSTARTYCVTTKNGLNVTLNCMVDYSLFPSSEIFSSQCTSLPASIYYVSILMLCSSNGNELEMDLKNIPQCIGKSCDAGHLYSTLTSVLEGVQRSFGNGSEWDWSCRYYHDFDSILAAPETTIEIPDATSAPETEKKGTSRAESHASNYNFLSLTSTVCLIATLASIFC